MELELSAATSRARGTQVRARTARAGRILILASVNRTGRKASDDNERDESANPEQRQRTPTDSVHRA